MKPVFQAFDGSIHETVEACKERDSQHAEGALVGLTLEDVKNAVLRNNTELADAIERIGAQIARARIAAGVRRRAPRGAGAATAPAGSNGAAEPERDTSSDP